MCIRSGGNGDKYAIKKSILLEGNIDGKIIYFALFLVTSILLPLEPKILHENVNGIIKLFRKKRFIFRQSTVVFKIFHAMHKCKFRPWTLVILWCVYDDLYNWIRLFHLFGRRWVIKRVMINTWSSLTKKVKNWLPSIAKCISVRWDLRK